MIYIVLLYFSVDEAVT